MKLANINDGMTERVGTCTKADKWMTTLRKERKGEIGGKEREGKERKSREEISEKGKDVK